MMAPLPPKRKIIKGVLSNYTQFEEFCRMDGRYELRHGDVVIDFSDLKGCLAGLPERFQIAVYENVILDKPQQEVADIMGVSPGSVGHYVDQAMRMIADGLFPELD